jgi:glycosyltransferase involved in cell wall biosynthesis
MLPPSFVKILHITECLAGGTLAFLTLATRELAESGVRQTLLYSRRPDTPQDVKSLFHPRVELVELPPAHGFHRFYFSALREAIRNELQDPDYVAIHLHSSKAGFLGRMALAGVRWHPRIFYSPHGLAFLNRKFVVPALVYRTLEKVAARVDSRLVGCSRSEARLLTQVGSRRAYVLENAADDSFFAITHRETKPPLIVSVGRVCRQKAPERFAELATRFHIAEIEARFVWVGGGDPQGEARLRAAGVHVTGWVSKEEVQRLLGEAAVYVQTSRWEGMPLSVLQALAAGVPCVVTDAVGNRDAVRQGITGYVVRRLDEMSIAVHRLLQDETLRRRFAQAARRDALERFSPASFRARLLRLYGFDEERGGSLSVDAAGNVVRFERTKPPVQSAESSAGPLGDAAASL